MSTLMLILLFLVAIFTAALSAITGMGGGILLFSFMTFFLPLNILIPVHGLAQFVSNGSRIFYFKKYLKFEMCLPYLFGAVIGVIGAVALKKSVHINSTYPLFIISLLIFYTLFKPKKLPSFKIALKAFFFVGILNGFLGIFVGAVGPFLAIFFVRDDFVKEEVIGNKAFMQVIVHFLKIPAFLSLGFSYTDHVWYWLPLLFSSVIGTKIGVKILRNIEEKHFRLLFKAALSIAGVRLLYKSALELFF
jgi:uncharacterized membrane protein YfcA